MSLSDYSNSLQKTAIISVAVLIVAGIVTHYSRIAVDEAEADSILNDVWAHAEQKKNILTLILTYVKFYVI